MDDMPEPLTLKYRLVIEGEYLICPYNISGPISNSLTKEQQQQLQNLLDNIPDRDLFSYDPGPKGVIIKREIISLN